MRNPLTHPHAGDIVEIIPGWTRTVIAVKNKLVRYNAKNQSGVFNGCVKDIKNWKKESKKAKVIHVAPEVPNA